MPTVEAIVTISVLVKPRNHPVNPWQQLRNARNKRHRATVLHGGLNLVFCWIMTKDYQKRRGPLYLGLTSLRESYTAPQHRYRRLYLPLQVF